MSSANTGYNPEFNPTGIEGGIDTNALPWIDLPQAPGMAIKPLRASSESGMFTVVVKKLNYLSIAMNNIHTQIIIQISLQKLD